MSPARAGTGPPSFAHGHWRGDTPNTCAPRHGNGRDRGNDSTNAGRHDEEGEMLIINGAGRIGRDAETRHTSGGQSVTSFSVACDGYNGERVTTWIDCSLWGKRGESLAQYLTKGAQVAFSGRGLLEVYDKRDGGQGAKISCNVGEIALMGGSRDGKSTSGGGSARPPQNTEGNGFSDDEVPF